MTIAKALEQIGEKLQKEYGQGPIPSSELTRQAAQLSRCHESSVIPSDFCYNRTNAGIPTPNQPMFIQEGRGRYRFVGTNFSYTGQMLHEPQGQSERVVGRWQEGTFTLSERE